MKLVLSCCAKTCLCSSVRLHDSLQAFDVNMFGPTGVSGLPLRLLGFRILACWAVAVERKLGLMLKNL